LKIQDSDNPTAAEIVCRIVMTLHVSAGLHLRNGTMGRPTAILETLIERRRIFYDGPQAIAQIVTILGSKYAL